MLTHGSLVGLRIGTGVGVGVDTPAGINVGTYVGARKGVGVDVTMVVVGNEGFVDCLRS